MGNLIIPVYILFTALHESGVMVEDFLTMQVSDNALSPSRLLVVLLCLCCVTGDDQHYRDNGSMEGLASILRATRLCCGFPSRCAVTRTFSHGRTV